MKKADIWCALTGMFFSGGAFAATLGFKKFKNVPVGPEFFPRALAAGLFICSAVLLIQTLKRKAAEDTSVSRGRLFDSGIRRLLSGIVIIVLYAIFWNIAGFPVITPIVLFALMFLLGLRRFPAMIIFSLSATALIFCAFKILLRIDMPLGFLERIF